MVCPNCRFPHMSDAKNAKCFSCGYVKGEEPAAVRADLHPDKIAIIHPATAALNESLKKD